MKKILTIALLALSFTMWGQSNLRIVDPNEEVVAEKIIAQMTFCLPLVEPHDTVVTLMCSGVRIEIPKKWINGELTIVIHPSEEDGPLLFKETVNWYLAPKSYYRDSLNINLY